MATYVATLLKAEAESNPEYARVPIEAKDDKDAKKQAQAILEGDLHGLGWTSFADAELWGKELRVLVDVVTEDEARKRDGHSNTRGTEDQAARFARLRKAAG